MSHATHAFPTGPSATLGDSSTTLALRIVGGQRDGHVVTVDEPKCTIGSSPECSLQLADPDVQSLHCLILRGRNGVAVRRWSSSTLLNGKLFADAKLFSGDRLTVGPLQLEVLDVPSFDGSAATAATAFETPSAVTQVRAAAAPTRCGAVPAPRSVPEGATADEPRGSRAGRKEVDDRSDDWRGTILCFVGIIALMIGGTVAARLTALWTWPSLLTGLTLASALACITMGLRHGRRGNSPSAAHQD
jgi:hypothetical protein